MRALMICLLLAGCHTAEQRQFNSHRADHVRPILIYCHTTANPDECAIRHNIAI